MKNGKNKIKLILLAFMILPLITWAQPSDPNDNSATGVPIDGGLGFLLAAGTGYAVKKLKKSAKNRVK